MMNKGTVGYVNKVNEVLNKADALEGCKYRMCITDDRDELLDLYAYLSLYAAELYRLNCQRLYIGEYGDEKPPIINL